MIITLKQLLTQPLNLAKSPLTPTLSRPRERELKRRIETIMPSPAGGRGCATLAIAPYLIRGWVRGYLPKVQKLNHAK